MRNISFRRLPLLALVGALFVSACATMQPETTTSSKSYDPALVSQAVAMANATNAAGRRVWCVPFARAASGIEIRGDAGTWWSKAKDSYGRSRDPVPGAVMAFSATRSLPRGHVAVVSQVVSDREILIDHANWKRSQVSLGMRVVDVSEGNDWSAVRVQSQPEALGRVYPVDGFILKAASAE